MELPAAVRRPAAMSRLLPLLLAVPIVLAACAAPGTPPSPTTGPSSPTGGDGGAIDHPTGDAPVLVVEWAGGFVPVDFLLTRLPSFVLLGDGRVIVQGAQTLEYPGPALPPLIERTLTEAGIQAVLREVGATSLFTTDAEFRGAANVVADAADTVFVLDADGRTVTVSIYGLGTIDAGMDLPGISSGEIRAHQALGRLNDRLMTVDAWLPADAWQTATWEPYEPDAFRLLVRDVSGQPFDEGLAEDVRPWPTDDEPAAFGEEQVGFGDGTRCGVVESDGAAVWLEELAGATQITRWTDEGGRQFAIAARPFLPHEERTCPQLFGA
jgi:hypothetical protein